MLQENKYFYRNFSAVDINQLSTLFLDHLKKEVTAKAPNNLYDPVQYIMHMDGKRIRPLLSLLSCSLFGGKPKEALEAAMAVEMFHNFSLIHDDIMDRAELRRGLATVHKKWDLNTGILSGDVLLVMAAQRLEVYRPELALSLIRLFNQTAVEVCEGQQLDMDFERRTDVGLEEYFEMIKNKTAVLLGCALQMGSMVAGASARDQKEIYDFGIHLGLAFQLQDDYLDTFGSSDFGKKIGGDILEAKKTFLYIKAMELASEAERVRLHELFQNPSEKERISGVKSVWKSLGVDQLLLKEIRSHTEQALTSVDRLQIEESGKQVLRELAQDLMSRNK